MVHGFPMDYRTMVLHGSQLKFVLGSSLDSGRIRYSLKVHQSSTQSSSQQADQSDLHMPIYISVENIIWI